MMLPPLQLLIVPDDSDDYDYHCDYDYDCDCDDSDFNCDDGCYDAVTSAAANSVC